MEKNRIILSFNLEAKSAPTRPHPPRVMSKPSQSFLMVTIDTSLRLLSSIL